MRYSDQHIHCTASFDAKGAISDMVRAAAEHGAGMVCFTDHMDMASELTGHTRSSYEKRLPDFLRRAAEYALDPTEGIEVRLGMELGAPLQYLPDAERAAATPGLDLVLGSIHNLPDMTDFYFLHYKSEEQCRRLNHLYLAELRRMAELDCFDVLAHIGYTSRYMAAQGIRERICVNDEYREELTALLRRLIERGKGLELNLSGYRGGGNDTYPGADVLRLYRELGGELITVGSDGHIPAQASDRIAAGFELLRECGFRYAAEYRARQPEMVSLTE